MGCNHLRLPLIQVCVLYTCPHICQTMAYAPYTHTVCPIKHGLMTSSNGNIFRVTGHLCGEFTGHTKASDAELWCFFFICTWIHCWVNDGEAGDLRRHSAHYDVIVMDMVMLPVLWRLHHQFMSIIGMVLPTLLWFVSSCHMCVDKTQLVIAGDKVSVYPLHWQFNSLRNRSLAVYFTLCDILGNNWH